MTTTTTGITTPYKGLVPAKGTYPMATNIIILKGTIVSLNATGYAVVGTDDNNAFNAVGIAESTVDNRNTSPSGGAAGAQNVEVAFGVQGLAYSGTPVIGQVVYVVDNHTVSTDSDSGTRGIAGYVSDMADGKCYVQMGPTIVGQIVIAASEASQLDTAQTDIDALQADVATAYAQVEIPLASFTTADATPLAKFADGATTPPGLTLADSETLALRWNNHATPGAALTQIALPYDLDDAATATLEFLCSKSGATLGDATTLTIAAYIIAAGDLHDADANCGGVTGALVGNATAKTTAVLSRTIAAADIPASARSMFISVTPTAGTLGTDDLLIHSARLRYTRKLLTA
jgi:hypothetical protein